MQKTDGNQFGFKCLVLSPEECGEKNDIYFKI